MNINDLMILLDKTRKENALSRCNPTVNSQLRLPPSLADDLLSLSGRLKVSKNALVVEILKQALSELLSDTTS